MSDLLKSVQKHPPRKSDTAPSLAETHPEKNPDSYVSPFPDTAQENTSGKYERNPRFSQSLDKEQISEAQQGPDLELLTQARDRLREHPYIEEDRIDVTVDAGVIFLQGHVPDQRTIVEAETCLKNLSGLTRIRNELTVSQ